MGNFQLFGTPSLSVLAVLMLLVFCETAMTAEDNTDKNPVVHGTINIILANQNGFVVVTDSMQTQRTLAGERQIPEPAQKLFVLDDRSVCTVAGFGSATLAAAPEFNTYSAGILHTFKSQLSGKSAPTNFQGKLTSLSFLFEFYLSSFAGLRDTIGLQQGDYSLQLMLAGYDDDGTPKIGALTLHAVISTTTSGRQYIRVATENIFEGPVRKQLTYLVAGQYDVATEILRNPTQFASAPPIRRYMESLSADGGSSLTMEELKQLAEFIVSRTADKHPSVGGPRQVAVIQKSQIASLEQPTFTPPPTPMGFNLMLGGHFEGHAIEITGSIFLWLKNQFIEDPALSIDGHYFFGNEIIRCRVHYDGGFARFDPSNRVVDSVLVIGKNANLKSDQVYRLIHNFPWREVVYEKK